MIVNERMVTYINSLDRGNQGMLAELEARARQERVPIIRREMQSFLKMLLALKRPQRILEVGTAVGFSALLMAEYTSPDCRITTIEKYEKRIPKARENFAASPFGYKITLLEGTPWRCCGSFPAPTTLFSWMPPKDSIFISCRKPCGFWNREA